MMNENQAREALEKLANKYLQADPELPRLIKIINDKARPGLPIRGILQSIRNTGVTNFPDADMKVIEELIYLYG